MLQRKLVDWGVTKPSGPPPISFNAPGLTLAQTISGAYEEGMTAKIEAEKRAKDLKDQNRRDSYRISVEELAEQLESILPCFQPEPIRLAVEKGSIDWNTHRVTGGTYRYGGKNGPEERKYVSVYINKPQQKVMEGLRQDIYHNPDVYGAAGCDNYYSKIWNDLLTCDRTSNLAQFILRLKLENIKYSHEDAERFTIFIP